MIFNREWAMPNSKTFEIVPILNLILKYVKDDYLVIDPFANEHSIKYHLKNIKYVCNDLDTEYDTDYHLEAKEFMEIFDDNSVDLVLYDPPYSVRQVMECYNKLDKTVSMVDTNSGYFARFKNEIARIVKPNGIVISFGWNTNGIGKTLGFECLEILDVQHGGIHNDTLVTVERKINKLKSQNLF